MGNFPFFRFPYNNYYYRYYPNYNSNNSSLAKNNNDSYKNSDDSPNNDSSNGSTTNKEDIDDISTQNRANDSNTRRKMNKNSSDLEQPIFEILGIYIYLDDLLILGLLFFLYTENVHDEILFITLILLLLS